MCGISGLVRAGGLLPSDEGAVRRMTDAMRHRGPDSAGHLTEGNVALGIRRLRIIDLATGDQPIHNEDRKVSVILNGEIYNYRDLTRELQGLGHRFATKSDTEVIVHGYEQWGEGCIERLRGMFAFAVFDRRPGGATRLLLARDRMGIKPLYYYRDGGLLLFASEVRALLATSLISRRVSVDGLHSYLAFGSVQEPLSLIEGVFSVPPAYQAAIDLKTGSLALRRYWDFPRPQAVNGGHVSPDEEKEVVDGLRPLLKEAVALRMIADVPLGAFLSGGIDSGAVVATMAKEATSPVKAFTIGFGESAFNEGPLAQKAARHFGVEHTTILLTPDQVLAELPVALDALDQPSIDGANTYYVSRAARQAGMTVALSGLGGDELFAGYSTFRNVPRMLALQSAVGWVPSPVRAGAAAVWSRANVASSATARGKEAALLAGDIPSGHPYFLSRVLFTPSQSRALMSLAAREAASAATNPWEQRVGETLVRAAEYDPINAISYLECNHYMVSTLLRDTDQMSMAHSLEVRVPLIDHKLVEYMMRVPGRYKLTSTDKTPKRLLVGAMSGALPAEVVNRKKTTFTLPWELWLRGQLRSEVETTLVTLPSKSRRYLEQGKARETWRAFLSGRTSWSRPWSLYVLCRWLERNAA